MYFIQKGIAFYAIGLSAATEMADHLIKKYCETKAKHGGNMRLD